MDHIELKAETVQLRMLRAVSGYGRRGTLVEVSVDTAAGLMENRLAEFVGVAGLVEKDAEAADGTVAGEAEPGGGTGRGGRRRVPRGGRGDAPDAEQGEGTDAG